jgi:hypothetical protein
MEIVQQRFENFKQFISTIPGIDSMYIALLNQYSLPLFLQNFKQCENLTVDEIVTNLCTKAHVNIPDVDKGTKDKFKRYIEYFQDIARTV